LAGRRPSASRAPRTHEDDVQLSHPEGPAPSAAAEPSDGRTEQERRALTNEDFAPLVPSSNGSDPRLTSAERQSFEDVLREYAKRRHKTQAEVERDLVAGEDGSTADFGELAPDCVCFANSAGGTLLVGIEDDDDAQQRPVRD